MIKATQIEYQAASSYGLSVNAMSVLATPTSDPYAWKQSLESCRRKELLLLQQFLQTRIEQGIPGYIAKIKKIKSRLSSVYCI